MYVLFAVPKPNRDSHVFCRLLRDVGDFQISDEYAFTTVDLFVSSPCACVRVCVRVCVSIIMRFVFVTVCAVCRGDPLDMRQGDVYALRYGLIADMIDSNNIQLI